jgi:hypothetical protein
MRDTVEIQDLVLRIPGIDRHDAERIARDIADRLSESVASWSGGDTVRGLVDLRVRLPAGTRRDEIASVVAAQIARALR